MLRLHTNNTLLPSEDVSKVVASLKNYTEHLNHVVKKGTYEDLESTINLPSDTDLLREIQNLCTRMNTKDKQLKYIVDVGIGGSNLGTKAIYDALYGFYDLIEPERFPKMIFLDTNDETYIAKLITFLQRVEKDEILINAISKSGGTTETIANLEILLATLQERIPDIKERFVITTDYNSKLWNRTKELGIAHLGIPAKVGGRFSALSAVGLFPLAACGIDIVSLRAGALDIRDAILSEKQDKNPAILSATTLFLQSKQGKNIADTFFFLPQLESIGKWYRQLMGESIGKEEDLDGKKVHTGITPTFSIGSTDLHSVGQLYLGGPRDKTTTFVYTHNYEKKATVPETMQFPLVSSIEGKRASDLMQAIHQGVTIAYQKQQMPFMEIELDKVDEKSLGAFLQFKMIEMMYLGKLLNVNTFDQPHVELYKIETKRILEKKA